MRVVGLDLSLTATGVANPDGGTATIRWTGNAPKTDRAKEDRILWMADNALSACLTTAALIAVEGLSLGSKGNSLDQIAALNYRLRFALRDCNTPYVIIPPSSLKSYATGKGNCAKTAMAVAAMKRAGLEFDDDNACDAWWLRAMALDAYGEPVVEVPKTHRVALGKVEWPTL